MITLRRNMNQQKYFSETGGPIEWPYSVKYEEETEISGDVLVLGGGISGCYAAIAAARKQGDMDVEPTLPLEIHLVAQFL